MAIANSIQILVDTNKRTVIKRIGLIDSDEQETVIIDPRALNFALNANNLPYQSGNTVNAGFTANSYTISRVIASVDAECGHIQLKWQDNGTGRTAYAFGVGYHDSNPQYQLPSIPNNAPGTPTGNLMIKSVGTVANACYTVIIELHKDSRYFSAGQFQDAGAFNYPPYTITP